MICPAVIPIRERKVRKVKVRANKMPKGTRVERCYTKLKGKMGKGPAAATCQKSTKQSLATGKSLKKKGKKK